MKFFLDTANLKDIKRYTEWGVIDGVTTNPSLIAKEGVDLKTRILEICNVVNGPISCEVLATELDDMLKEAREYHSWHKNIYVKLPTIENGIKALTILAKEGVKVNMTLVFNAGQALVVAKAGAKLVSPFIGRLDDIGQDGLELVEEIIEIYDNYNFETEILVASTRNPRHIIESAKMGANICTMPAKILDQITKHPLTDNGLKKFLADWESVKNKQK